MLMAEEKERWTRSHMRWEESGRGRRVALGRRTARELKRKKLTTPAVFLLRMYGLLTLFHWRVWNCGNDGI